MYKYYKKDLMSDFKLEKGCGKHEVLSGDTDEPAADREEEKKDNVNKNARIMSEVADISLIESASIDSVSNSSDE